MIEAQIHFAAQHLSLEATCFGGLLQYDSCFYDPNALIIGDVQFDLDLPPKLSTKFHDQ